MTEQIDLPRDASGKIIISSPEIKAQAMALRAKLGYSAMDARKAIYQADGDMKKAEAILVATEGFKYSKLVTYR